MLTLSSVGVHRNQFAFGATKSQTQSPRNCALDAVAVSFGSQDSSNVPSYTLEAVNQAEEGFSGKKSARPFFDRAIVWTMPLVPKAIVRKIADPYIAGETIDEMVNRVRELNNKGVAATVDLLGEYITEFEQAEANATVYHEILERLDQEKLNASVSIKLTAFGLGLKNTYADSCYYLVKKLVEKAEKSGRLVQIDMEDFDSIEDTLAIYSNLKQEFPNTVSLCLQAKVKHTFNDVTGLMKKGGNHFRICKGIYKGKPENDYQKPEAINLNYLRILETMIKNNSTVCIATHDPKLVEGAKALLKKYEVPKKQYEFQMLLGVAEGLRDELVREGHPVRVYTPFGQDWYGYSLRRFKENPKIAGYVFDQLFNKN